MGRIADDLIKKTEDYVKKAFDGKEGHLLIAHGFEHVNRVRNWALLIAKGDGFEDLLLVHLAALLHDICFPYIEKDGERIEHAQAGAEVADMFLRQNSDLKEGQIKQIVSAIRYHSSKPSVVEDFVRNIGEEGRLTFIIRDADSMDAIGAVGLMRAFGSRYFLPEYDPDNVKGVTWRLSADGFTERFETGLGVGKYSIDQVNWQISYPQKMHTKTARQLAEPLVKFMEDFVLQLEHEINFPAQ
jgi:HD superfamily phosphodiesterase